MHTIAYDARANMLRLTMSGFWTLDDVHRFTADLLTAVARLPKSCRVFDVLSDARDFPVQPHDVAHALRRIMAGADELNKTGRKAVIVGSMMNKLQAERTLDANNQRIFLSLEEAEAWLASPRDDLA